MTTKYETENNPHSLTNKLVEAEAGIGLAGGVRPTEGRMPTSSGSDPESLSIMSKTHSQNGFEHRKSKGHRSHDLKCRWNNGATACNKAIIASAASFCLSSMGADCPMFPKAPGLAALIRAICFKYLLCTCVQLSSGDSKTV